MNLHYLATKFFERMYMRYQSIITSDMLILARLDYVTKGD